jgi:hypothetical protein
MIDSDDSPKAQKIGTKLLVRSAVDYDAIVAPTGRHGFREEVASNGRWSTKSRVEGQ